MCCCFVIILILALVRQVGLTYRGVHRDGASGLINMAVRYFREIGTALFGGSLLWMGQILTVVLSLGLLFGHEYLLAQIILVSTAVCFGYGFCNPSLSAAASNAAGKSTMGHSAQCRDSPLRPGWRFGPCGTVIPARWRTLPVWIWCACHNGVVGGFVFARRPIAGRVTGLIVG